MRFRSLVAAAALLVSASLASAQPANTFAGNDPTNYSNVSSGAVDQVQWWSFTLTQNMGPGQYLIIDDWNNTFVGNTFGDGDAELGIYDSAGNRLGNWDDFGTMSRRERVLYGDAAAATTAGYSGWGGTLAGLAAGTYYVGSAPYNVTWNATGWSTSLVVSGTVTGNAGFQIFSNVPEPTSIMLLGLGGLLMSRRARRAR